MRNLNVSSILTHTVTLTALFISPATFANRTWDSANDPANMGNYNYNFDQLPTEGSMDLSRRGWSDTYWPFQLGMIAYRWQVPNDEFRKDHSPDASAVFSLNEAEISQLSPAEKFDLARGDYQFTLGKKIRKETNPNARDWRGICNGWTQSSLNFDEPRPTVFTNKDGLKIPFGASDIKALLAYYYAKEDNSPVSTVGRRCKQKSALAWTSAACSSMDVNAGSFHMIMANELGIQHKGFAADRDPFNEVWNQPYVKFESHVVNVLDKSKGDKLSRHASDAAVREITLSSDVYFADDDGIVPSTEPYIGTDQNKITKTVYNYVLDVDAAGQIIGGDWLDSNRPDFMWRQEFHKPTGDFEILEKIYEQSVHVFTNS